MKKEAKKGVMPVKQIRNERVELQCTISEKQSIKKAAKEAKMSVADYLRYCIWG